MYSRRLASLSFALAAVAAAFSGYAAATELAATTVTLNGATFTECTVIRESVVGDVGVLNVYCPNINTPGYAVPPEPIKYGWHVYVTDGLNVREGYNCVVDHLRTLGGIDSYTFLCSS